jgi:hypothetical protein
MSGTIRGHPAVGEFQADSGHGLLGSSRLNERWCASTIQDSGEPE